MRVLNPGTGRVQTATRREGLSTASPVPCTMAIKPSSCAPKLIGKGSKHANRSPGPWVSALRLMPKPPVQGAKRAAAGLADTPINTELIRGVMCERAARCLTSILPFGSAGFILGDTEEDIRERSPEEIAERLVANLSPYGSSSLDAAFSTLGRILSWVQDSRPDASCVRGSDVTDWLGSLPAVSNSILTSMRWLRDWCGIDLPGRGPATRPFRGRAPSTENDKESLSLAAVCGLELIAANPSNSRFVRSHAAGWCSLARMALRLKQSNCFVINAVVSHPSQGTATTIVSGSVRDDKHPDPSKKRPRPVWGAIDGLLQADALSHPLAEMLHPDVRCILRDTDSPSGSPLTASRWLLAPLSSPARVDASLHALLMMPPISMPASMAERYHGHSAKRFLLNFAEACPGFGSMEATEIARFSQSTAQNSDMEPTAAMLQAHSLRVSILPDIYSKSR